MFFAPTANHLATGGMSPDMGGVFGKGYEMALTPEGRVKAEIKAILKERGIWFFMPQGGAFGASGIPDFICCLPDEDGKLLGIEAKALGKRNNTTALQDGQIAGIRAAKGLAIVVDDPAQVEEFLDDRSAAAQRAGTQGQQP